MELIGKKNKKLSPLKKSLIAFGISFLLLLLFVFMKNITEHPYPLDAGEHRYPWDSGDYWSLSMQFFSDDSFSFLNYPDSVRGYIFPFLLFLMRSIGLVLPLGLLGDVYSFRVISCAFFAFTLTIALPYLFTLVSKRESGIISRVAVVCLTAFFFPGLLLYPLSDFYAFGFTLCALSLLQYVNTNNKNSILRYAAMILMGILLYFAYNTRPAFLIAVIFAAGFGIALSWKNGWRKCLTFTALLGCGWMLAAFPEMLINNYHHDTWSFAINTTSYFSNGMAASGLFGGLTLQSNIGSLDEAARIGGIYAWDRVGLQIHDGESTIGGYIKIVLSYPLEYIGICIRHLINCLNPVFGEIYVYDLQKIKIHYTLINYILMFAASLGLVVGHHRVYEEISEDNVRKLSCRENILNFLYFLPLIIPSLLMIPMGIEIRYILSLYMLMYGYLAFAADWQAIWALVKRRYVVVSTSFFVILFVFIAIWSSTFADMEGVTMFMR